MNNDEGNVQESIDGFDPRVMFADGLWRETGDLLVGGATDQVIGRISAMSFLFFKDHSGTAIFDSITVVVPPLNVWPIIDTDVLDYVRQGVEALRGKSPNEQQLEYIRKKLIIHRCLDLDSKGLLEKIKQLKRNLVIVPMAHVYRDVDAVEVKYQGRASVGKTGDTWVPHVAAWSDKCIRSLKDSDNYLVLATPENPPSDERHIDKLASIEKLSLAYLKSQATMNVETIISGGIQRWTALAVCGRVDEALGEIAALDVELAVKRQLEIQMLNRSSFRERTLTALKAYVDDGFDLTGDQAVRFGRIAFRSGSRDMAIRLISEGLNGTCERTLLEATLITCESLKDDALTLRVFLQLKELFPDSPTLARYRQACLIRLSGSLTHEFSCEWLPKIGFVGFELVVAEAFLAPADEKLNTLILTADSQSAQDRDLALLCCATYSLTKLDAQEAITLALGISDSGLFRLRACWLLIGAMKRTLLEVKLDSDPIALLEAPIAYLRRYIAGHPDDVETREAFTALFAVESSANLGTPILIAQTLSLAQDSGALLLVDQPETPRATAAQLSRFLSEADAWLVQVGFYDVSRTEIPAELMEGEPLAILHSLESMIRGVAVESEDGLDNAEHLSFLACGVARHVSDTTADINALRFVACSFASGGQTQRARDRAEQILEIAGDSVTRQRAAWVAFADIYHRTRGPLPALLGLAFAFELKQPVVPDELWWENYTLFRIVRDLGVTSYAQASLDNLKRISTLITEPEESEKRIRTLELSMRLLHGKHQDLAFRVELVADAEEHCNQIMKGRDEILPAIVLLAQSIGLLEHFGGCASESARALLEEALSRLDAPRAKYVRAMTASKPTIADALHLAKRVDPTRNSGDVPGDLRIAEIAARRVLKTNEDSISAQTAATALELIADHALDPLDCARELDTQWPLEFAQSICPEDGAVLMLGLDSEGALVSLTIGEEQTLVSQHEGSDTTFRKTLKEWAQTYPYRYGYINREEGNNEFFLSMQDLQIPIPNAKRTIVVAEPAVQQVPLNLALFENNLAGYQSAIGYVPSLTWLYAKSQQLRTRETKRVAWISEATGGHDDDVLVRVLMRTESTLRDHGFDVETEGVVPVALKGAQIAVVAAHGGVGSGGKFFHRLSDEGNLVVSPSSLATALEGAELVILFVCSGGRTDKHPHVNTAVGLPKHLLSRGCRTVIASPWPLFASVPGPWLESFLKSWDGGLSALDATFAANQAVESHFGNVPQYSLAMTVYGDVLMSKE